MRFAMPGHPEIGQPSVNRSSGHIAAKTGHPDNISCAVKSWVHAGLPEETEKFWAPRELCIVIQIFVGILGKRTDTVGELISMRKADLSARDFPSFLCSKKLYTE
jgi:hypothetical protein